MLTDMGGPSLTLKDLRLVPGSAIDVLGGRRRVPWRQAGADVVIDYPRDAAALPVVLRLQSAERADPTYRPQ